MSHVFTEILREELIPALGCTEPIAIAYACAKARAVLGNKPERMVMHCSGNMIKNVQNVIVPGTGNLCGIETAAILGMVGGNADKQLEVLAEVTPADVEETRRLLEKNVCSVEHAMGTENLYVRAELFAGDESASVTIADTHTNITEIKKNGEILFQGSKLVQTGHLADRSQLSLENIYEYANTIDLDEVRDILRRQIECNTRIAEEGLRNAYGACVGRSLIKFYGEDVKIRARAWAAAGSDARMGGCTMPVVINSGSGNQGMAVSLPVVIYAREQKASEEQLYRALVFSNLLAIYQQEGIGKLSAYCGAVSAACAAGAGVAYLKGEPLAVIEQTIENALGNVAGIICDGANSSCAAKIASAVDAALLGYYMASDSQGFSSGEGIIKKDADETIKSVSRIGREGMKETDVEVLRIMLT